MNTHATSARTVVDVNGAAELLHRVVGAADRRSAALLLRAAGRDLDLGQVRAVTMDEGRSVVIATAATGAALAVRWFAPGEATTAHDHGSWGAAVVLDGALRYERFETAGNTVVAGSTLWIENDDIVWWDGPPSDVHRQTGGDLGALELIAVGAAPTGRTVQVTDHLGDARPLIDAVRDSYLTRDASLLSNWYADDVVADVCVPAWRFQLRGREQVLELLTAAELGQPNQRLTSFRAWPMPEGAIIEVAVRFADGDGTKAWRDLHVLRSRAGRIVEQVTYCTGHWDAAAIAAQEATAPMVRP